MSALPHPWTQRGYHGYTSHGIALIQMVVNVSVCAIVSQTSTRLVHKDLNNKLASVSTYPLSEIFLCREQLWYRRLMISVLCQSPKTNGTEFDREAYEFTLLSTLGAQLSSEGVYRKNFVLGNHGRATILRVHTSKWVPITRKRVNDWHYDFAR